MTDRKQKQDTENQITDLIQTFKTANNSKSEERIFKLIGDLESDKKSLQTEL